MRKKQKKIIVWSVCVLCLGLIGGITLGFQKPEQEEVRYPKEDSLEARHPRADGDPGSQESQKNTSIENKDEILLDSPLRENDLAGSISESIKIQESDTKATFKIGDSELEISVSENTSVYDAMKTLSSEGKIILKGKNYIGLGYFVTQVGPLVSGEGKNLMYYINDKEASLGVSSYIVKEGDIIEWKLK